MMPTAATFLSALRRHRRLCAAACALLWLAALTATHWPGDRLPSTGVSDKQLHFVGYFGLAGALLLVSWAYDARLWTRLLILPAVLLTYAALDEITQPMVNRYADVLDWAANAAGALSAVFVLELVRGLLTRRG